MKALSSLAVFPKLLGELGEGPLPGVMILLPKPCQERQEGGGPGQVVGC